MSDIPIELQGEILKLLPLHHLVRLRPVCKEWLSIIDSFIVPATLLIRKGMPRGAGGKSKIYSLPLDSLETSSSNLTSNGGIVSLTSIKNRNGVPGLTELPLPTYHGLILITSYQVKDDWTLWSPFNGVYGGSSVHTIPAYDPFALNENEPKFKMQRTVLFGLGYDASSSDYKVVRVARIFGPKNSNIDLNIFRTSIYSLKSQTWHRIEDFPRVNRGYGYERAGVFMQGALHWIASVEDYRNSHCIVALDLSSENYRRLPLPSTLSISSIRIKYLDVVGGHLFLSCNDDIHGKSVWLLKDYGEENKWAQLASFKPERDDLWYGTPMRPVAYLKSKEQVILHYDRNKLMWLDVEKQEFLKKVTIKDFEEHGFSCQQMPARLAWLSGMCRAADESFSLNRTTLRKRKRVDSKFEISVCKHPKHWSSS